MNLKFENVYCEPFHYEKCDKSEFLTQVEEILARVSTVRLLDFAMIMEVFKMVACRKVQCYLPEFIGYHRPISKNYRTEGT